MGYYLRVLAESEGRPSIGQLIGRLVSEGLDAEISVDEGEWDSWSQIAVFHPKTKDPICLIERNVVEHGSLAEEELAEFAESVAECQPESAARWLQEFFPRVETIYAFQLLSAADLEPGSQIVRSLRAEIWNSQGGILQADGEGFTNEKGHHILWQFSDSVSGAWQCAVLDEEGRWLNFTMDLGNPRQRRAFLDGKVPSGVRSS